MDNKAFYKSTDFFIIAFAVFICIALYMIFGRDKGAKALIIYDSKTVKEISLKNDTVFSVDEAPDIVFEIKNGSIAFIASDCPDKVCINTGRISHSGQSATCLPNKMMIVIEGGADNDIDAIAN